jgi:hypothetical protein
MEAENRISKLFRKFQMNKAHFKNKSKLIL